MAVNAADAARRRGDTDDALEKFGLAAQVYSEGGPGSIRPRLESAFLSQFGIFLMGQNQLEQALSMQQRALQLDEQHGTDADRAFSRHNLAGVLAELGRTDEAVAMFKRALSGFQALGMHEDAANTKGALGTTLIEADRLDEAEPYL